MKRLCKAVDSQSSKADEIEKFKKFYNECAEGSYLRMILDNAGIQPHTVENAIQSDFGFVR